MPRLAIVARLAPDHTVVVLDRTGDVVVDLGDPDDVRRAAGLVLDRHGRCDVFVHAAATFAPGPLDQVELGAWRQVRAVNVESALLLTQAFVPGMRDRGFGRVIFIVSNTFWSPPDGQMLSYVASKGALIGMARTLAVGLGGDGIAVTAARRDSLAPLPAPSGRRPSSPIPRRTWRWTGRSHPTTPPRSWPCSPATRPKPHRPDAHRRRRPGHALSNGRRNLRRQARAARDPDGLFAGNLTGPGGVRDLSDREKC